MKYIQALLTLVILAASTRHREKWRRTTDRLSEQIDAIEASFRRIEAMENGGKPKIRVL